MWYFSVRGIVMDRKIEIELLSWKENRQRKPLLLDGMRQVGKTWILEDFGAKYFKKVHYFNFDKEIGLCDFFRKSKDPEKIVKELSFFIGQKIDGETDLIIFDEIQECNEALNSLKYFCESTNNYFVVGAGSYLGITLSKGYSFPVGKIQQLSMYPMTFKEFLNANGNSMLVEFIESINSLNLIPLPLFEKLSLLFKEYYFVGGMPEVVDTWIKMGDIEKIKKIQGSILNAYRSDFSKYAPREIMPKILEIWDSVVGQLSRENKKFKYSEVKKSSRAREYETSLNWLVSGSYFKKILRVSNNIMPLAAYAESESFKIYLSDVGLLRQKADFDPSLLLSETDGVNIPFKGALAENIVMQELTAAEVGTLYYWMTKNNQELDFMLQIGGDIVPIEVKYGVNVKSKSLSGYLKENPKSIGIKFSMRNLRLDWHTLNIPIFMVSEIERLYALSK
jgi:uncharacterized protein